MRTIYTLPVVVLAVLLVAAFQAACATAQADADSSSTSTQPSAPQAGEDETTLTAEQWLARIEQRADAIETLRADLQYERVTGLLGDRQIRAGELHYVAEPTRFAVHFDRVVIDDRLREQDRWYIFDGRWLAERQEDKQVFIRRDLAPQGKQDAKGEQMLEMTGGPFLLPLDLEKEQVLERFEVSLVPTEQARDEDDRLANTIHLRLTPRPHVNAQQTRLDVWYDRETALPVRVRGQERGKDHWTLDLMRTETGIEIDPSLFDTRPPDEPGWQVEYTKQ